MQLISVNKSKKKTIEYEGKAITTGIFKKPISGPVFIGKENLAGDEQADLINHGGVHKAIYAFSSEHYGYWREELKNLNLHYGVFGENLTISGLDEASLFIGDRLSIGECILEVSQPRVPCYKLGLALNNTKVPRLFSRSFNTGAYFRVIQEGFIEAGDVLKRVASVSESVSIRSLFQAYFDKDYAQSDMVMSKAVLLEELAPEWKDKLVARLARTVE